jgi:copper chaperone
MQAEMDHRISPEQGESFMERKELSIGGMSCEHCVSAVRGALERLEGVAVEKVEIGTARIGFEPGRIEEDRIREAVEEEGYSVQGMGDLP